MASYKAPCEVPIRKPTADEIASKLATIGADKAKEILSKLCAALLCNGRLLSDVHSTILQAVTTVLHEVFPTLDVEEVVSSAITAHKPCEACCETPQLSNRLMRSKTETDKSCANDLMVSCKTEPESSDEDSTDDSFTEKYCVPETPEKRFLETSFRTPSKHDSACTDKQSGCKNIASAKDKNECRCLFTSTPKVTAAVSESEGFSVSQPSCRGHRNCENVTHPLIVTKHEHDVVCENGQSACKPNQSEGFDGHTNGHNHLVASTPEKADMVGESEGFAVSQLLARNDTQCKRDVQMRDATTDAPVLTAGDATILQNSRLICSGGTSEDSGTLSVSSGTSSSAELIFSTARKTDGDRPLTCLFKSQAWSDTTSEDDSDPSGTSEYSAGASCSVSDKSKIEQSLEESMSPSSSSFTTANSPYLGVNHTGSCSAVNNVGNKRTLHHVSQAVEDNLKQQCQAHAKVCSEADSHSVSRISGPNAQAVDTHIDLITCSQNSNAVIVESVCSLDFSGLSEGYTQPSSNNVNYVDVELVHPCTTQGSTQQCAKPVLEKNQTLLESDSVVELGNGLQAQRSDSEDCKIFETPQHRDTVHETAVSVKDAEDSGKYQSDRSDRCTRSSSLHLNSMGIKGKDRRNTSSSSNESVKLVSKRQHTLPAPDHVFELGSAEEKQKVAFEAQDANRGPTVPVKDIENSDKDSVGSGRNQSKPMHGDKNENVTEYGGHKVSFPRLQTAKRSEKGNSSLNTVPNETLDSGTRPAEETGRRHQSTSAARERLQAKRVLVQTGNGNVAPKKKEAGGSPVRQRRKPVPFSLLEEEAVFYGYSKYSNETLVWKKIHMKGGFVGRTTRDLRDKYRNLENNPLACEFVKRRVEEKCERNINPLKELREYNKHKRHSLKERNTACRSPISRERDKCTSPGCKRRDEDAPSDNHRTSNKRIHEWEDESDPEVANPIRSSRKQVLRGSPCCSKRKEHEGCTAASSPISTAGSEGAGVSTEQDSLMEDNATLLPSCSGVTAGGQRKRQFFCDAEVEALVYGVLHYGKGQWILIKQLGGFDNRSSIDLANKYRNLMQKAGRLSKLKERVKEKESKGMDLLERWKRRHR